MYLRWFIARSTAPEKKTEKYMKKSLFLHYLCLEWFATCMYSQITQNFFSKQVTRSVRLWPFTSIQRQFGQLLTLDPRLGKLCRKS